MGKTVLSSFRRAVRAFGELLVLLACVTIILFFLLRATGDPAAVLAGPDATAEQLAAIRSKYGLDRSLPVQLLGYLGSLLKGDFGTSLANGRPAIKVVLEALPATLLLAGLALLVTCAIALPLGAWLGERQANEQSRGLASLTSGIIFLLQGTPGFVAGLILIQIFAVELNWAPAVGAAGFASLVLPVITLAMFLVPKQVRLLAKNVASEFRSDYVRTAIAIGTPPRALLRRHVLPNAVIGSLALLGTQAAMLVGGAVVTESIFAWPGMGLLLLSSVQTLDFPIIQAVAFVTAILVFVANSAADRAIAAIDPRTRVPN